jgi:Xaa-Pro aminopeptidase
MFREKRIGELVKALRCRNIGSFLVTSQANIQYLSGFSGHDSAVMISKKGRYILTDSRYIEEAGQAAKDFTPLLVRRSMYDEIAGICKKERSAMLGFEANNLPFAIAKKLQTALAGTRLVNASGMVEEIRQVKDPGEIAKIKKSVGLAKKVMGRLAALVRPGASEKELAIKAEMMFLKSGARPSFDPIVASGANSSKPHARPMAHALKKGTHVMIDIGCCLDGYCSDMTRTFFIGKHSGKFADIYGIVKQAQKLAIEAIAPGVEARKVDAVARDYITNSGYGDNFGHSLGHGVGLEVHEGPSISSSSRTKLAAGMVFTVEPAIYLPGQGGVRAEEMVLVTKHGCEILTK